MNEERQTVKPPPGWGDDQLTSFFENMRTNTFASYVQAPDHAKRLLAVESALRLICENLKDPRDKFAPFFLLKAHSSFLSAANLAMAGSAPEAFMVMRGCLESALYGLYVNRNADSFEVWLRRNEDDAAKKRTRTAFMIGNMWKCLGGVDAGLQREAAALYERAIDMGGHPNAASLMTALNISKKDGGMHFELAYLTANPEMIRGSMKSVAQTGVTALGIFRHVFKERYDLLGLTSRLPMLREGL
jgi:hypothetical protein